MFVYFFVLLDVFLLFFTFGNFSNKKRIFATLAEAISVFLCLFSFLSAIMWTFECFTVEFCLIAVSIVIIPLFTIAYFKSDVKGKDYFLIKEIKIDYRILANSGAVLVAVFLSVGAYSTFGIGFNDGNSETIALSILGGNNQRNFKIEEFDNIKPESKYEYFFFDTISNIDAENFTANYWISESENGKNVMLADFGCNPVYPSILALSAKLFGTERMALIQAIIAFCLFVFIDEILRVLRCDWKLRSILILLLGISPIIVYCNHTCLIEPLLGLCMVMFFYFLLCKENTLQMMSVIGIITFSFLHTSVYTMLPMFLAVYWMYYIHTREKRHLISSLISIIGYILSFIYLNIVAYENTSINYRLGLPLLKDYYYLFVVFVMAVTILAAIVLSVFLNKTSSEKVKEFEKTKGLTIFKIGVTVVSFASIVLMIANNITKCESFKDALNLTFISFAMCTGVVLIPYIVARLISGSYTVGIKEGVIVVSFIYTVLLYSSIMKITLDGYYYEARYLATFLPFVILAAGILLHQSKGEGKYFVPVLGIVTLIVPTIMILSAKTETRIDKDIFSSVIETVEADADENTVIFIEKDLMKYFYFPLLNKTEASVDPREEEYIYSFCLFTKDLSSKVIYITDSKGEKYSDLGTVKYLKMNTKQEISSELVSTVTGLPNAFNDEDSDIVQVIEIDSLDKFINPDFLESFSNNDIVLSISSVEIEANGIAHVEVAVTDGNRLFNDETHYVSYHLDYEVSEDVYDNRKIKMGPFIAEDYSFDFNLTFVDEEMTAIFDVEEGSSWYSSENEVPSVTFFINEDGKWDYLIDKSLGENR